MMDKKCVTLCVKCVIHSHRQMSKVKIFLLLSCFASIMLLQGFVFEKEVTTLNMDRHAIVLYNPSAMFRLQKSDKLSISNIIKVKRSTRVAKKDILV